MRHGRLPYRISQAVALQVVFAGRLCVCFFVFAHSLANVCASMCKSRWRFSMEITNLRRKQNRELLMVFGGSSSVLSAKQVAHKARSISDVWLRECCLCVVLKVIHLFICKLWTNESNNSISPILSERNSVKNLRRGCYSSVQSNTMCSGHPNGDFSVMLCDLMEVE